MVYILCVCVKVMERLVGFTNFFIICDSINSFGTYTEGRAGVYTLEPLIYLRGIQLLAYVYPRLACLTGNNHQRVCTRARRRVQISDRRGESAINTYLALS